MKKFGMISSKKSIIFRIIKFLSSMKLAIVVLSLIAILSGLSTLLPQKEQFSFYIDNYGLFGELLFNIGFTNFFNSNLFLIIIVIFFINLLLCTIKKICREATGQRKVVIGPDIIHIGILLLLVGGALNIKFEQRASVLLSAGDELKLGLYTVLLKDFQFHKYIDGAPKDWISTISVMDNEGNVIKDSFNIEVNKPFRFKGYSLFQSSYRTINEVTLKSNIDNKTYILKSGYKIKDGDNYYSIKHVSEDSSITFNVVNSEGKKHSELVTIGKNIGDYKIIDVDSILYTGLLLKREPGYAINITALFIVLIGLLITYLKKIKENR